MVNEVDGIRMPGQSFCAPEQWSETLAQSEGNANCTKDDDDDNNHKRTMKKKNEA